MRQLQSNNLITKSIVNIADKHKEIINQVIDYNRDNLIDYFGFKTLERAYLMRVNKVIVENLNICGCVSIGIHGDNIEKIKETYEYMSQLFTHYSHYSTQELKSQLSSCFLLSLEEDSIMEYIIHLRIMH